MEGSEIDEEAAGFTELSPDLLKAIVDVAIQAGVHSPAGVDDVTPERMPGERWDIRPASVSAIGSM